ncbi:MAG: hypothetical protein H7296_07655 [Bacteroidia bacterium]|nr:hypothetical protein [Bacteroidia bacterium]
MLDLQKLKEKLDLALSQETEESLMTWLKTVKSRELFASSKPYCIKGFNWVGAKDSYLNAAASVESMIHPEQIMGFKGITYLANGEAAICEHYHKPPPPNIIDEMNFEKNMTPSFSESFFCLNL